MSQPTRRGHLKIYFGYAVGVGKTYQMLQDARELKARGTDIVIGFLDPAGGSGGASEGRGLEVVGSLKVTARGSAVEEMDVAGILKRAPQACVVDELAHSNAPGSPRSKRWEDVQVLIEGGIDVLTTMNVQDLASLSDQIWQITGIRIRETVPDWVLQEADEVVIVDVTPRALLHRLERGAIHSPDKAKTGTDGLFQEPRLAALRELAIRQTAQALEARRAARRKRGSAERILVNITADASTATLLRRARRVADYLHGSCVAVCVHAEREFSQVPAAQRQAIERHLRFAQNLHIDTAMIQGSNRAHTLMAYAHKNTVTQIYLQRDATPPRRWFPGLDFTDQVVQRAGDLEVIVVADRSQGGQAPSPYPEDEAGGLMHSSYIRVRPEMTIDEAITEARRQATEVEMMFYVYAVDASDHLIGVLSLRQILAADRSKRVADVMRTAYVSVLEDTDKEEVAHILARRRLLAVPVLDSEGRMRGIVNSADVAGVVQQEAGEDIQKIGGMEALEGPYMEVTFAQMVRKRAGWLAILFLGEMLTATAMGYYSDEIGKAVILALFLPLIISSGGNSGSQATTLVIRAMAMGEIRLRDWWRVVRREIGAGVTLGAILGLIGITRILVWQALQGTYGPHYLLVALTIGCSLVGVVLFGTIAGSMLPFILRGAGLDPASASAPFVATLVDVTGLIIYFSVASVILRGTLL
jgi:magnesium transporter